MRSRGIWAIGVVGVVGVLLALAIGSTAQGAALPTPGVGYRDQSYTGGLASRATSEPEQSKLWYAGGGWWGPLFHASGSKASNSDFEIHQFNPATSTWTDDISQVIDKRDHSHADYLYVPSIAKLYVASSKSVCPVPPGTCNDTIEFWRLGFNASASTLAAKWTIEVGPLAIPGSAGGVTSPVTIARDSMARLWITYTKVDPTTSHGHVEAWYTTTPGTDTAWAHLDVSAAAGVADLETGQDNTAAVVAFGTKVGIWWTDRHASAADVAHFSVHDVANLPTVWSDEPVVSGTNAIDDQVNLKVDSSGRVYAVAKTGVAAQIKLWVRAAGGTWSTPSTVATATDGDTRAQVSLDGTLGGVGRAIVTMSSGGRIYYKMAPLNGDNAPVFPSGVGTVLISSTTDNTIDDATTMKQGLTAASGFLVLASDRTTLYFFHNTLPLADNDATPPTPGTPVINGGAATTPSGSVSVAVPATDTGTGVPFVRVSESSAQSGGVLTTGTTRFWAPVIPWTFSAVDGSRSLYVQFQDNAGNWSSVVTDAIVVDRAPPVASGTPKINGGATLTNKLAVTVSLPAADATTSVANVRLSNDAGTTSGLLTHGITSAYAASKPWTLAAGADGSRTVFVQWQDAVGHWSGVTPSTSITLDTTPPARGTVLIDGGATFHHTNNTVTLAWTAGLDAPVAARAANDATFSSPVALPGASGTTSWTLPAGLDGTRMVYVEWRDAAGNWSAAASDSIVLDTRRPVGAVLINGAAAFTRSATVNLTFPNTDADVDKVMISNQPTLAGAVFEPFKIGETRSWTLPTLTNGQARTVYVRFHDTSGNVSAATFSDSIVADLTRPTMGRIAYERYRAGDVVTSGHPIHISWTAGSDTVSGIGSYRVQYSRDGHAYVGAGTVTARGIVITMAPGHTYRVRVAAIDRAGNVGRYAYSPTVKPSNIQEISTRIVYRGTWHTQVTSTAYGGRLKYSTRSTSSAAVRLYGRSVAWVAPTSLTRGTARVYIDGVLRATVKLAGPTTYRRIDYARTWSADGWHRIRIVVVGFHRVDIDAFLVLR